MASHKKRLDLEKLQKNHYSSPSYKYLTYFIHRSLPGWMFTTGDKTATGYHLDFTGSEKSRDKIGYHCLLCSDPHRKIDGIFKLSDDFFQLDDEAKQAYARPASGSDHGWVAFEREKVSADRPADYKEAFNITEPHNEQQVWPDDKVPSFQSKIASFFKICGDLSLRILHVMALGLQLKDPETFTSTHKVMESTKNCTTLRLLNYPVISKEAVVKPGQIRCGEHTDYGSITLLFQDDMPGLEVLPLGFTEYIPAPPFPGAIIVNVADLMQRWTADRLKSTRHRVSIPEEECQRRVPRRSLAFFVHPDDDTIIKCLDGSEKYPSITAYDYQWQRLNATYEYE